MRPRNTEKQSIPSIEEVAQHFEKWRATRVKRCKIPSELWALVAPLMNQYGHNKIATALRVNHAQLKEHTLPLLANQQQTQSSSARFVECPLPMGSSWQGDCIVEIACKNGSTVKISGLASIQIQSIISSLVGN